MSNFEKNELAAAIDLALERIRPSSMMAKVLEAMVNKPANGLPRMTYDLNKANEIYAAQGTDFIIPSIWELIGLDVAPYPSLWDRVNYARDNAKSIRTAVYGLKDQFEDFGNYLDEDGVSTGRPIGLYIFNKNGPDNRDTNVVTADPTYENAFTLCTGKSNRRLSGVVTKTANRLKVGGRNSEQMVRDLAAMFHDSATKAELPVGLGAEIQKLENNA